MVPHPLPSTIRTPRRRRDGHFFVELKILRFNGEQFFTVLTGGGLWRHTKAFTLYDVGEIDYMQYGCYWY